jgi:cytoskeletal protein RodZ
MFDKLSEELKAARIRAGLTLQQLANKSRIDLKFLEYIEDGNFSFLPELYVKAFLKEYARFVGIDEKLVFKKYEAYKQGKEYVDQQPESFIDHIKELKDNRFEKPKENLNSKPDSSLYTAPQSTQNNPLNNFFQDKKNVVFVGAVAGVLVLFLAVYFLFIRKSSDIVVEKPYEELVNESKGRYIEDEPVKTPADSLVNTSAKTDSLKLLITATDSCWVKALLDSSKREEFKLYPHSSKLLSAASNFKIIFGNSFRIQLQLNNKALSFDAKTKVSNVYIDSKGLNFINPAAKQN